jgi:hypothetical protein
MVGTFPGQHGESGGWNGLGLPRTTITRVVGCRLRSGEWVYNKCNNTVKVLITLESMLRDRECYYILAVVNKVVRSFRGITDPLGSGNIPII